MARPMRQGFGMARVREAGADDVEAIAHVHVASWQAAYRGVFPDEHLDDLSTDDRGPWLGRTAGPS